MKISVALCSYNGEKFIREQLESMLRQTRLPDEIIVCDDQSKDKTAEIAREVLQDCGVDYQVIVNEKQLGAVRNFEQCGAHCNGDIVFFSDQDDVWLETKVEKMAKKFEQDPQCVLCFCDASVTDSALNVWSESLNRAGGISAENFLELALRNIFPYGCTMAVKKELIVQNAPFPILHDRYLSMCAAFFGTIHEVKEPLMLYRRHEAACSGYREQNKIKDYMVRIKKIGKQFSRTRESWFGWPGIVLNGYERYYQRFGDRLQEIAPEAYTRLADQIQFSKELMAIISAPRIKAIKLLRGTWESGLYSKIRGNRNMLRMDYLHLLFGKK